MGAYETLMASAALDMPLQDNAASTVVVDNIGTDGSLAGGHNTEDIAATGPTAWFPSALHFDDSADYVDCSTVVLTGDFTAFWWANRDGKAGEVDAVFGYSSQTTSFIRFDQNEDRVAFRTQGGTLRTIETGVTTNGEWHSYALVKRSDNLLDLYVDGSLVTADNLGDAASLTLNYIGKHAGNLFDGRLAGCALWTSALSDADVAALHAGPVSGSSRRLPSTLMGVGP